MKPLVTRSAPGNSGTTVIEYSLVIALIGLACIPAWMHFSASLNAPAALVNTTASVETTGSVRSRGLHRAPRIQEAAPF